MATSCSSIGYIPTMLRGSSASITFYRPSSLTKTILGSANEIVTVQLMDSSIPCELKLRHLVVGGQEHVFLLPPLFLNYCWCIWQACSLLAPTPLVSEWFVVAQVIKLPKFTCWQCWMATLDDTCMKLQ